MCLLDGAGVGISHAIGVGSNDMRAEVGGVMTLEALDVLIDDGRTEVIGIVSKPPDPAVVSAIRERMARADKPCVLVFVGKGILAASLEDAAAQLAALAGAKFVLHEVAPPRPTPGSIRGLFCGGSLCHEAIRIVSDVEEIRSNIASDPRLRLHDLTEVNGSAFVDFGEQKLIEGRAHPMIDPGLRNSSFRDQSADPDVGVFLLDVVLGYGAHPDPAADLAPLVSRALDSPAGPRTVIATVVGTAADPQHLESQVSRLEEAGALVTSSVTQAAHLAVAAAGRQ
jgi:FdrA protein